MCLTHDVLLAQKSLCPHPLTWPLDQRHPFVLRPQVPDPKVSPPPQPPLSTLLGVLGGHLSPPVAELPGTSRGSPFGSHPEHNCLLWHLQSQRHPGREPEQAAARWWFAGVTVKSSDLRSIQEVFFKGSKVSVAGTRGWTEESSQNTPARAEREIMFRDLL